VPACVSSLIPSTVGQLDRLAVRDGEVLNDLLTALARVIDPRAGRGGTAPAQCDPRDRRV
jgi:hypothetical protein